MPVYEQKKFYDSLEVDQHGSEDVTQNATRWLS